MAKERRRINPNKIADCHFTKSQDLIISFEDEKKVFTIEMNEWLFSDLVLEIQKAAISEKRRLINKADYLENASKGTTCWQKRDLEEH